MPKDRGPYQTERLESQKAKALEYFKKADFSPEITSFWKEHSEFSVSEADQIASAVTRDEITQNQAFIESNPRTKIIIQHLRTLAGPVFEYMAYSHLKANHTTKNTDFVEIGSKFDTITQHLELAKVASASLMKRKLFFQGEAIRAARGFVVIPDGLILNRDQDNGTFKISGVFESSMRLTPKKIDGVRLFVRLLKENPLLLQALSEDLLGVKGMQLSQEQDFRFLLLTRANFDSYHTNAARKMGWIVEKTPFYFTEIARETAIMIKDSLESGQFTMEHFLPESVDSG